MVTNKNKIVKYNKETLAIRHILCKKCAGMSHNKWSLFFEDISNNLLEIF